MLTWFTRSLPMPDPTRTVTAPDAPITNSLADGAATTAGDEHTGTTSTPFAPPGYDLGEEVGQGGMGVVFRARDLELNREVAVKILLPKYAPGSATARRFVDEAQITSQLQHPGVPPVYRVGHQPDGRPVLAMKLIKGQTLADLLACRDLTSRDRRGAGSASWLGVFEPICQAVGYAHAHGVIHRDLKPQNVMVGSFGEVQVMDWGLAKVLGDRRDASPPVDTDPDATASADPTEIRSLRDTETQAGSLLGTPAYMAPEQAIGAVDQIDRRTDVFGLGAILCSLLTGQPPFVGDSAESTRQMAARAKLDDAFARLDACGAEPDLVAIAKRCLSAEKTDRPADARELATAIAALRAAADDRARRAEIDREKAVVQAAEQRKRRRVVQWAGGIVAGVLLAGVIGTAVGLVRAEDRRAEAERVRDRALTVLDDMTSDSSGDALASQRSITPEQRRFLLQAATHYEYIVTGPTADTYSRERKAAALARLAAIKLRLGDEPESLRLSQAAATEYDGLAHEHPGTPRFRCEYATAVGCTGDRLCHQRRYADGIRQFETAIATLAELTASHPDATDYLTRLAGTHNQLGLTYKAAGRLADAKVAFANAIQVQMAALVLAPDDQNALHFLANHHHNLGIVCADSGEAAAAEVHLLDALAVHERLAAKGSHAGHADRELNRGRNLEDLGRKQYELGKKLDGLGRIRAAMEVFRSLVSRFPSVPEYENQLAKTYAILSVCTDDPTERK
jgi:serine/threonine protein kinase